MQPAVGMEFDHARFITGSPTAGTARPERFVVTAIRRGSVYYRPVDHPVNRATHHIGVEKFASIVREGEEQ